MDEDSVFTKRFVESVKKPHEERTDQVSKAVVGIGGNETLH